MGHPTRKEPHGPEQAVVQPLDARLDFALDSLTERELVLSYHPPLYPMLAILHLDDPLLDDLVSMADVQSLGDGRKSDP